MQEGDAESTGILTSSCVVEENKKSFVLINQKGIDPPSLEMLAHEASELQTSSALDIL